MKFIEVTEKSSGNRLLMAVENIAAIKDQTQTGETHLYFSGDTRITIAEEYSFVVEQIKDGDLERVEMFEASKDGRLLLDKNSMV